jgi:hypothetical protein
LEQTAHDASVEFVLDDEIFNVRVNVRVVIDLDDQGLLPDGLDVHAVEPVTDKAAGLDRSAENIMRDLVERHGDDTPESESTF